MTYLLLFICVGQYENIDKLQNVQNIAARIITDTKKHDRITPALEQLVLLPVRQMLSLRDANVIFKCLKGLAPPYLSERFIKRSEVTQSRH